VRQLALVVLGLVAALMLANEAAGWLVRWRTVAAVRRLGREMDAVLRAANLARPGAWSPGDSVTVTD
jgi:hypothetical protein